MDPPHERERAIDFALRAVGSVMQQRLVFGDIEPARFRLTEAELSDGWRTSSRRTDALTHPKPPKV